MPATRVECAGSGNARGFLGSAMFLLARNGPADMLSLFFNWDAPDVVGHHDLDLTITVLHVDHTSANQNSRVSCIWNCNLLKQKKRGHKCQ